MYYLILLRELVWKVCSVQESTEPYIFNESTWFKLWSFLLLVSGPFGLSMKPHGGHKVSLLVLAFSWDLTKTIYFKGFHRKRIPALLERYWYLTLFVSKQVLVDPKVFKWILISFKSGRVPSSHKRNILSFNLLKDYEWRFWVRLSGFHWTNLIIFHWLVTAAFDEGNVPSSLSPPFLYSFERCHVNSDIAAFPPRLDCVTQCKSKEDALQRFASLPSSYIQSRSHTHTHTNTFNICLFASFYWYSVRHVVIIHTFLQIKLMDAFNCHREPSVYSIWMSISPPPIKHKMMLHFYTLASHQGL